jgi:hypothetical protein
MLDKIRKTCSIIDFVAYKVLFALKYWKLNLLLFCIVLFLKAASKLLSLELQTTQDVEKFFEEIHPTTTKHLSTKVRSLMFALIKKTLPTDSNLYGSYCGHK